MFQLVTFWVEPQVAEIFDEVVRMIKSVEAVSTLSEVGRLADVAALKGHRLCSKYRDGR